MITNWKIFDTNYMISNGLITKITYGYRIQSEGMFDQTLGELQLSGDATLKGFIPYEDLTEDILIEWVKTILGSEKVIAIETLLQTSIENKQLAKLAETVKSGLPWEFNHPNV